MVICLDASQSFNEPLHPRPEAEHFQGIVEPAHCNAEIRLRGYMVNAVVSAREDHVIDLQERDHPREIAIRVRHHLWIWLMKVTNTKRKE